jgi:hypothetical protein
MLQPLDTTKECFMDHIEAAGVQRFEGITHGQSNIDQEDHI